MYDSARRIGYGRVRNGEDVSCGFLNLNSQKGLKSE